MRAFTAGLAGLALLLCAATLDASPEDPGLPFPGQPAVTPCPATPPAEVRVRFDLQAHPAMHLCWEFFAPGLTDKTPSDLTWRHTFKQVAYAPYLKASGVRLMGVAAMSAERAVNPEQARRMILEQIGYVDAFVARHPDDFAVARTPAEARRLLTTTKKLVFIHQIEGGRKILTRSEDADFWRRQGVSLITLIHLWDDELGGAALNLGILGSILNPHGSFHPNKRRGLTDRGKAAITDFKRAGIILDMSHMSPDSVQDALVVCRNNSIPPVVTHGCMKSLQNSQRAFTDEQILEIYRLGGLFSMPVDGHGTEVHEPRVPVPPGLVKGTQDFFKLHADSVAGFLRANAHKVLGKPWGQLSDAERTKLACGWASDWNGWVDHSEPTPRHGNFPPGPALEVDKVGLAHPGLLPQYFLRLHQAGWDEDPFLRSAERFLQIWERVQQGSTPR